MAGSSDISSADTLISRISPSENRMVGSTSKCPSLEQATSSFTDNSHNVCEFNMTPDLLNRSFSVTLKLLSPAASSGPFCRICHEGDNQEDLVSLCKCTGSVGLVHLTCMERWLNTRRSGHDKCEICNYTFETTRSPKSVAEWYRSDQGSMSNRHSILGDLACLSLITPLAAVSTFLCFEGAKRHIMRNNSLEAGCLMALATFLLTVYVVWNVLTIRYHLKSYFKWRTVNQTIRLIGYRRKSTNPENSAFNQSNAVSSTTQIGANESPLSESATSDQQTFPLSSPLSESVDVHSQTSNLCLTET